MKKSNLFFVLMMALIVMSCSKDETSMGIPQEGNAIEFGTYVGRDAQTRAGVQDISTVATNGFGVFAYYTDQVLWTAYTGKATPNFMNNQKVTGTGDASDPVVYTWTYSPIKYWPNNLNDKVTFLAYAPWKPTPLVGGVETPFIVEGKLPFTVENSITTQTDLLWNTTPQINKEKQSVTGTIDFKFSHALSRIGLTLIAAVDQVAEGSETENALAPGTTITVNSVTLGSTLKDDGDVEGKQFYTSGVLDLSNIVAANAWTSATTSDQTFVFDDGVVDATNNTVAELDAINRVIKTNSHQTAKQLNVANEYLMVIPQDFKTASSTFAAGFNVTVNYDVETIDDTGDGTGGGNTKINNTITRNVKLKLEAGKAYTLKLHIGMTSVDISAEVADWVPDGETVVNVPVNTN